MVAHKSEAGVDLGTTADYPECYSISCVRGRKEKKRRHAYLVFFE